MNDHLKLKVLTEDKEKLEQDLAKLEKKLEKSHTLADDYRRLVDQIALTKESLATKTAEINKIADNLQFKLF
jgi:DNA repair ATPase RecN